MKEFATLPVYLVIVVCTLFLIGLVFRPVLYVLLGVLAIGLLLFALTLNSQKEKSTSKYSKPQHVGASSAISQMLGGGGGSNKDRPPSGTQSSGSPNTVMYVVFVVVGLFIILVVA